MKLNERYNQEYFIEFSKDFLPEDLVFREEDIIIKKDRYKEINKAKILGFCESLDLYILEMDHNHDNDPRISIATNAFKILADHWIHKALVIFKNKDSDNYRLSYLTITLDLNEKNEVIKRYSNARRYSFYLGVNAKVKTPEQQLVKKGKVKNIEDLLSRFSVEVVNKQFYLEVAKHFDELVQIKDKNLSLPGDFNNDLNLRKSFAVRLIGRIMFCWFLKQKKSESGQLMPDELLSSKFVLDNYYHNILEPLFFGILNTNINDRDIRNSLFDKVPYLNGGLFNPQVEDFYDFDKITFSSRYLNILKITDFWFKNFFELLETYNFTIDENTVFDQELSVDPEMLGRIFENLLAEINPETGNSEKKRTGSFYTPRPIVEYMVDQSLIEYFKTKTTLSEEKLKALISYDTSDDSDHPLTEEEKLEIVKAIDSLRALDPACGSGAFPIGLLQKIVYILQVVDFNCTLWVHQKLKDVPELYRQKLENDFTKNPPDYIRKLEVIKNSIFGVDIQPIAVDISRLRCFLTLVVESEIDDSKQNRGIDPLPNLDFKFVCANTLIPLPKTDKGDMNNLFDDHTGIAELSKIMSEYFSCNSHRKNELKIKFTNTQKDILEKTISAFGRNTGELTLKLTTWNPFGNYSNDWFDLEWMFGLQEKFDIVIGNPPYISAKSIDKLYKEKLAKIFKTATGQFDLYTAFIEYSFLVLKDNGISTFITANTFLSNKYFKILREILIKQKTIKEIINFGETIFETAKVGVAVIIIENHFKIDSNVKMCDSLKSFQEQRYTFTKQEVLDNLESNFEIKLNMDVHVKQLMEKLFKNKKAIGDFLDLPRGIEIGSNSEKISNIRSEDLIPLLVGKNIKRYSVEFDNKYIKFEENKSIFKTMDIYNLDKILIQRIRNLSLKQRIVATIDSENFLVTNTLRIGILKDKNDNIFFYLGLLNSSLINFIFLNAFHNTDIYTYQLQRIPLPYNIDQKIKIYISERVSRILALKKQNKDFDTQDLEREIDRMVYKLYELEDKEIRIIEEEK